MKKGIACFNDIKNHIWDIQIKLNMWTKILILKSTSLHHNHAYNKFISQLEAEENWTVENEEEKSFDGDSPLNAFNLQ